MKKAVGILFCSILLTSVVFGQNRKQLIKQKIYEKKVEFIKSQVAFTPEEEKAFWPLYNDYMAKKDVIRDKYKDARKYERGGGEINYEQYNDMVTQMAVDDASLRYNFYLKMKKVLPAQKIYQLFQAERNFKKELLDKVSDGKNGL
ncbi:MAG: hypothetical protein P4L28_11840 [Paludibacteraceae bacterium]|nr:hypothetical protein [Paludibacteraceae bacterium]